jgi:iron complex outermembrane receptor protein
MQRKLRKQDVLPVLVTLFILAITLPMDALAQARKITGKVQTGTSELLQGVNVLVKGNSRKGAVTDNQGMFALEVSPADVLVISFIGLPFRWMKMRLN